VNVPEWKCHRPLKPERRHHEITTIGIDLAKNVFSGSRANARRKAMLHERLRREQVMALFANLPACLIGMNACGSAHH
jgi:transposase